MDTYIRTYTVSIICELQHHLANTALQINNECSLALQGIHTYVRTSYNTFMWMCALFLECQEIPYVCMCMLVFFPVANAYSVRCITFPPESVYMYIHINHKCIISFHSSTHTFVSLYAYVSCSANIYKGLNINFESRWTLYVGLAWIPPIA